MVVVVASDSGRCSVGLASRVRFQSLHICWLDKQMQATHLTGGLVWRWFTGFQYEGVVALAVVGRRGAAGGVERAW